MNIFFILFFFLLEVGSGSACYVKCLSERINTLNTGVMMSLLIKHNELHRKMIEEIEEEIEATASETGLWCTNSFLQLNAV